MASLDFILNGKLHMLRVHSEDKPTSAAGQLSVVGLQQRDYADYAAGRGGTWQLPARCLGTSFLPEKKQGVSSETERGTACVP